MRNDEITFIGNGKAKLLTTHSDVDLIIQHIENPDAGTALSEKLEEKLKRIQRCHALTTEHGSRIKVVPELEKEFSISFSTALRIYEDTQLVFAHKLPKREYWIDIALGRVFETWKMAKDAKDIRGMNAADANMIAIMEKFLQSADRIPYEEFKNPKFIFGFFPQLSKVKIPENWRDEIERIIQRKRNIELNTTDAVVLDDEAK